MWLSSNLCFGVQEIRIHVPNEFQVNEFPVAYVVRFPEAVHVLHLFSKKSQKAVTSDLRTIQRRHSQLLAFRILKEYWHGNSSYKIIWKCFQRPWIPTRRGCASSHSSQVDERGYSNDPSAKADASIRSEAFRGKPAANQRSETWEIRTIQHRLTRRNAHAFWDGNRRDNKTQTPRFGLISLRSNPKGSVLK